MDDDEPFGYLPDLDGVDEVDPLLPPFLVVVSDDTTDPIDPQPSARIPHRYRRSVSASVLAAGMLGLRDVLEAPRDDRPVVEQHVDEHDRRRPVEVQLDPDDPAASIVRLHPPPPPPHDGPPHDLSC
ncbi:MAG: hypothetical protein JST64_13190 [Actinobacteria bacterium]|nr:hypothetical protein [Actinomycetota bacterium]